MSQEEKTENLTYAEKFKNEANEFFKSKYNKFVHKNKYSIM